MDDGVLLSARCWYPCFHLLAVELEVSAPGSLLSLKRWFRNLEFSENYLLDLNSLKQSHLRNSFLGFGFFSRTTMFLKMFLSMFGGFPFRFLKTVKVSSPLRRGSTWVYSGVCSSNPREVRFFRKGWIFHIVHLILPSETSRKSPSLLEAAGCLTRSGFRV